MDILLFCDDDNFFVCILFDWENFTTHSLYLYSYIYLYINAIKLKSSHHQKIYECALCCVRYMHPDWYESIQIVQFNSFTMNWQRTSADWLKKWNFHDSNAASVRHFHFDASEPFKTSKRDGFERFCIFNKYKYSYVYKYITHNEYIHK